MKKSKLFLIALSLIGISFSACEKESIEPQNPQISTQQSNRTANTKKEKVFEANAILAPQEEGPTQRQNSPKPFQQQLESASQTSNQADLK